MSSRICIFGEVLFDLFPDGRRVLGGAPFNVAWNLQAFGERPLLISRVGTDGNALSVLSAMQVWGMDASALQTGPGAATGLGRGRSAACCTTAASRCARPSRAGR